MSTLMKNGGDEDRDSEEHIPGQASRVQQAIRTRPVGPVIDGRIFTGERDCGCDVACPWNDTVARQRYRLRTNGWWRPTLGQHIAFFRWRPTGPIGIEAAKGDDDTQNLARMRRQVEVCDPKISTYQEQIENTGRDGPVVAVWSPLAGGPPRNAIDDCEDDKSRSSREYAERMMRRPMRRQRKQPDSNRAEAQGRQNEEKAHTSQQIAHSPGSL